MLDRRATSKTGSLPIATLSEDDGDGVARVVVTETRVVATTTVLPKEAFQTPAEQPEILARESVAPVPTTESLPPPSPSAPSKFNIFPYMFVSTAFPMY